MNIRETIMAFSQSEKIKSGLIWVSQAIELANGLPEPERQGAERVIKAIIEMVLQEIGLAKGDLTDEEIAVEVVRQFLEAMIAEDYAKAGRLCGGIPAATMKEQFGRAHHVRVVSLGTPTPHPDPRTRFLCVPCEVEVSEGGATSLKSIVANVRPVYGQPDRWAIGGGI